METPQLPQGDMLADDIFGEQKEYYEKSRVINLLLTQRQEILSMIDEASEKLIADANIRDQHGGTGKETAKIILSDLSHRIEERYKNN